MSATQTEMLPAADPAEGLRLVIPGRHLPAGEGWSWIAAGWKLFTLAPLMWIVSILVVLVLAIVVSLVPIVGSLAFQVLNATIGAGFVVACRSLERGGEFELEHLFAGFRTRFANLLLVGLLLLAGWIAIFLVFAAFAGFSILAALMAGHAQDIASSVMASAMSILLGALVACALTVPLLAAYWFAPALVVMHGLGPVEAMKESFVASFRNFGAFLVYGIIMLIFAIVAAIPFGLGYLVWVPLAIASTYAAYRAIFTEDATPAAALAP